MNVSERDIMKNDCTIRLEKPEDHRTAETLCREAFWNVYRPGCLEHYVLHCLRSDPAFVPELDYVMERGGQLIGQNVFVRASIQTDDGREVPIMTMGPIWILPEFRGQGYGKFLLDYTLERAANLGVRRSASRAISISTAKADSVSPGISDCGITACPPVRMIPSFSAASSRPGI